MTNTRVLVTGATGKIGGAVAAQLLEKGMHDQGVGASRRWTRCPFAGLGRRGCRRGYV